MANQLDAVRRETARANLVYSGGPRKLTAMKFDPAYPIAAFAFHSVLASPTTLMEYRGMADKLCAKMGGKQPRPAWSAD